MVNFGLVLEGDLRTMGLPDLLQWVGATGTSGVLTIDRPQDAVWVSVRERAVVGVSPPTLGAVPMRDLAPPRRPGRRSAVADDALALEHLYDQFLDADDRFRFDERATPPLGGVPLELPIQLLVMEGMRHLDEWPAIRAMYATDSSCMTRVPDAPTPSALPPVQSALMELASEGASLSDARLTLGLTRPSLLRNVEALRRLGVLAVAGTPRGGDLITKLLNQATLLLKEQQFDEAAHVFSALLSADPGAPRIKALLRQAEREQTRALYKRLPATAVVATTATTTEGSSRVSRTDRTVLELVNGRWDIATLVLASPLREVETLKALQRLARARLVKLELPQA
jgi:hypothetical protein